MKCFECDKEFKSGEGVTVFSVDYLDVCWCIECIKKSFKWTKYRIIKKETALSDMIEDKEVIAC